MKLFNTSAHTHTVNVIYETETHFSIPCLLLTSRKEVTIRNQPSVAGLYHILFTILIIVSKTDLTEAVLYDISAL